MCFQEWVGSFSIGAFSKASSQKGVLGRLSDHGASTDDQGEHEDAGDDAPLVRADVTTRESTMKG